MGTTPHGSLALYWPTAIGFDSTNNQAIVQNSGTYQRVKINAATGMKTALPNSGSSAQYIAVSSTSKVYTVSYNSLNELNTSTGESTIISGAGVPNDDNLLGSAVGLALDETNGLAYVSSVSPRSILAVNLSTGVRTLVTSSAFPDEVTSIGSLVHDADNTRLLVLSPTLDTIYAVNTETGAHTIFSSNTVPDTSYAFGYMVDVVMDKSNKRVLVLDNQRRAVTAVDLLTGTRTNLNNPSTGVVSLLSYLQRMTFIPSSDQVMITDRNNGVVLMDAITGEQVILAK